MPKTTPRLAESIKDRFTVMTKRRMSNIMAQSNGMHQIFIKTEFFGDGPTHRCHMIHMFNASTDVVIVRREEHLCFVFQSPISKAMQDSPIVTFEWGPDIFRAII